MSDFKQRLQDQITSSAHLSSRHVHPKLLKMFEMGGMTAVFNRAQGQYVWDVDGNQYLDFLSAGGAAFAGRNQPEINEKLKAVLELELPNLSIVNASLLGGLLAGKLLEKAGPHFSKVMYGNSGTEATEVAIRFARYVTRRRRFLYLENAFHGRTFGAVSLCGDSHLKDGMTPMLPTTTPIKPNDLRQLRNELRYGDVAGVFMEPLQGMTCQPMDQKYLREAELLCEEYGSLFIADEVQTGLGRTGDWFVTSGMGIRPHIMTVSKTLSGGQVPVSAVLISEEIYERVFERFGSGLFHFSTFGENNLAMAAGIATLEYLESIDAPARARELGEQLHKGLAGLAERYDVIDRVQGRNLMTAIYFKNSASARLGAEQAIIGAADSSAFAAAVNVELYRTHRIIVQIPGVGVNAIKVLPPACTTPEDISRFIGALDEVLAGFYEGRGPAVALGQQVVGKAIEQARSLIPGGVGKLLGTANASDEETAPKKA